MSIPVFRPTIKRREMDAVLTCMVSDRIGPDQQARELVHEVSTLLQAEGGLAFREYVRAVEWALSVLELEKGSPVAVSPLLPGFYGDILDQLGLVPHLVDVDPETGQMSPELLETMIESRAARGELPLAAVILPATLGFCPDLPRFKSLGIPLVEDISEGLGATREGSGPGLWGDVVILAMEMEHLITSGGGTLVLVRKKELLHSLEKRREGVGSSLFLPDMNAALGLAQMNEREELLEKRKTIAGLFHRALMKTSHKTLIQRGEGEPSFFSFPVIIDVGLGEVQKYAMKHGVETRQAFHHSLAARLGDPLEMCPMAASLMSRCLLFPLYPFLGSQNIQQIEKVLSTLP